MVISYKCNGGNSNNCLDCLSSDFRNLNSSTGECNCIGRYFDNNVAICETCHYSWYKMNKLVINNN